VARIRSSHSSVPIVFNYEALPGAIPLPATLSLELGKVVSEQQANISYRFLSDLPFNNRAPHQLDRFEINALANLRMQPNQQLLDVSWSGLTNRIRLVTPVIMGTDCVACHNSHPDSPKTDWKAGEVRGIQEVIVSRQVVNSLLSFKYLLIYFTMAAAIGFWFICQQRKQAIVIGVTNQKLEAANKFLSSLSTKISHYLAPQVYKSVFSGQTDTSIHTQRKKLSIFFSDVKDFTSITERLQPEEITTLLNEYFSEMSSIALRHGGTIDKFIGDAILIFFGDPESKGVAEDAASCLHMAMEMQQRLAQLNVQWRARGILHPFLARMSITTGFCNVGNFGSNDRMEYTIIGAQVNLAARLQAVAEPGTVVLSYETYALVRHLVSAHAIAPISMKGISLPVVPYIVDSLVDPSVRQMQVLSEHSAGLDLYLDVRLLDPADRLCAITAFQNALSILKNAEAGHTDTP
jgi:adenylate cyclase